jgi:archaeal cell division control protein 6
LEAHKRQINLLYIHINCREYRGKLFSVIQHTLSVLNPKLPLRGYGTEELMQVLLKHLDEENTHIIWALDEFDVLIETEGSDAVYNLSRIQEMRQGKPQRISFIGIMRDLESTKRLDDSAKSTLQRNIIRLVRYGKIELADILGERVAMAFEPSTVPEDVINLTADLAQDENGNARFGIELLWRAGKYADAENLQTVTPECVRLSVSNTIPTLAKSELENLGLHEQLFLLAAAEVFVESGEAYVALSEIEKTYGVVCEEYGEQPVSHTMLWKYLQKLSATGVLKSEVSGEGERGRQTLVYLPAVSAEELAKSLRLLLKEPK